MSTALGLLAFVACAATAAGAPRTVDREQSAADLDDGSFTFVPEPGVEIHYEIHGDGPPLMVMPNSWGLSLAGLRGQFQPLEERLSVVYFDPRGMGASSPARRDEEMGIATVRSDFEALRRHLGLGPVPAFGWSNGATNLLLFALERPASLAAAVVVAATAHFGPEDIAAIGEHPKYRELFAAFGAIGQELADPALSEAERDARVKRFDLEVWFPRIAADPEAARPLLAAAFAGAGFSNRHAQYSQRDLPAIDLRDRLPGLAVRTLVVGGAHDMLPAERFREVHGLAPVSEFLLFEQSGHFPQLEEPEAFARAVWEFLAVGEP